MPFIVFFESSVGDYGRCANVRLLYYVPLDLFSGTFLKLTQELFGLKRYRHAELLRPTIRDKYAFNANCYLMGF